LSERLALSRTPLLVLMCGVVPPHGTDGSMVMSARPGVPGAWLKFTLITAVSGKNFFHRLWVDSPPPDEFIADNPMVYELQLALTAFCRSQPRLPPKVIAGVAEV